MNCPTCKMPEPRESCWASSGLACFYGYPPRHLTLETVWAQIITLNNRVTELENRLG